MTRRSREGRQRTIILGSALLLSVCCAAIVGWSVGRIALPAELERPVAIERSGVSVEEFSDRRTVDLSITLEPSAKVTSPSGGLLTSSSCSPDAVIEHGGSTFAIDGTPLVDLATAHPLWRTLEVGAKGTDVRELQESLALLGFEGVIDGVMGPRTIAFFNGLRRAAVPDAPLVDAIAPSSVVWLPSDAVTGGTCLSHVGAVLQPGDALVELPPRISALRLGTMPRTLPARPRVVSVDGVPAGIDEQGNVDRQAWPALASTPSFRAFVADPKSVAFKGEVQLVDPIETVRVPPSAIVGASGDRGCVWDGDVAYAGAIVSSQLGYTLMTFDDDPPSEVEIAPGAGQTCP